MNWSMDDYIDYYYETAMEAERDYNDFIEVAIELYKELKEVDNIVFKNYKGLLLWSRELKSSDGKELNKQFEQWHVEFRHKVNESLKANGLSVIEPPSRFEILPFDLTVIPYTYDSDFSTIVDILTEHSHGNMFNNGTNVPYFHDYCEYADLSHAEMIKVFERGLDNIDKVRNSKLELVEDLCDDLREQFSSTKLLRECEKYVFR